VKKDKFCLQECAMTDYGKMLREIRVLTEDCPYKLANISNAIAVIFNTLPDINWAGIYFAKDNALTLGPFQGKPACTYIPFSRGVCGKAAREMTPIVVADVHSFPDHIACDGASRSEIVLPLVLDGVLLGVLDIDSPRVGRFSVLDREGLLPIAELIAQCLSSSE